MAVRSRRVDVGTAPTRLNVDDDDNVWGGSVAIVPAAAIEVGDSAVAAGAGFEVGTAGLSLDLGGDEVLYGVAATGTVSVQVLATGVA